MSRISTTKSAPPPSAEPAAGRGIARAFCCKATLALALLGPAFAFEASAQVLTGPGVTALTTVVFCAPPDAGRREAPGTLSGWIHVPDQPPRIIAENGNAAPMVLGLGFGVDYAIEIPGPVTVTNFVEHPPMGPGGATRQQWSFESSGFARHSSLFQFDMPEEMVPGLWTLSAEAEGQILFRAEFTIRPAGEMPELAGQCRGADMLSLLAE